MDAASMKRQFLEHIEIERGRAVKTIENYDRYLTRFFEWAKVKDWAISPKTRYGSFASG
jgi:site-specific recombinase XerD